VIQRLKGHARRLKRELTALYLAARDPRTPWYARLVALAVVAYALSPLDLIPDVIPIFGLLDDLVIVPIGFAIAIKLIPPEVLAEWRARAREERIQDIGISRLGAIMIVAVWLVVAAVIVYVLLRWA